RRRHTISDRDWSSDVCSSVLRGAAELTYRRFFDVSTLAAVRVEDPEVFEATHAEILRWVHEGAVDGLRVDHPDGLSDPGGYARRLRAAIGPDRWLVVE